jgi:hypothetical protein
VVGRRLNSARNLAVKDQNMYVIEYHRNSDTYFVVDACTGRLDNQQYFGPRPRLTKEVAQARADELNLLRGRVPGL